MEDETDVRVMDRKWTDGRKLDWWTDYGRLDETKMSSRTAGDLCGHITSGIITIQVGNSELEGIHEFLNFIARARVFPF